MSGSDGGKPLTAETLLGPRSQFTPRQQPNRDRRPVVAIRNVLAQADRRENFEESRRVRIRTKRETHRHLL